MKISFIILTYNRSDALLVVLRSLAAQCGAAHEVVIADDGSNASEVQHLRQQCPPFHCPVKHVWHPDTGFTAATARNLGVFFSSGDYLVFLDGDCVPNKNFVAAQTWLAERGYLVNGSLVLLSPRLSAQAIANEIDLTAQSAFFWWAARLRGDSNKLLHMLPWPWSLFRAKSGFQWRGIRSCNMAVWRDDFLAVNGFDQTFEGWGHEDADLVLRLSHLGVRRKNGFLATEVFHLWHPESQRQQAGVNRQKVLQRMRSGLILAEQGVHQIQRSDAVTVTPLY